MRMLIIDEHPERLLTSVSINGFSSLRPDYSEYEKEYANTDAENAKPADKKRASAKRS